MLDADPLAVIAGELGHRPEVGILLGLTDDASRASAPTSCAAGVRTAGPAGRPIDHLLARDFPRSRRDRDARRARLRVVGG